MKKRDLNDIFARVQGIKDPEIIRKYVHALGERSLYSLMYGDEPYKIWSNLEMILTAYTCFSECTDEELTCCMKRISFKDFLSLVYYLDDDKMGDRFLREKGILRDDFGIGNIQEIALAYLLKLMIKAEDEGDEDAWNFCAIHSDSMLGMIYADEPDYDKAKEENFYRQKRREKAKIVADYFDYLNDRMNLDEVSWLDITIYNREYEFARLRELLLYSMGRIGFPEEFSFQDENSLQDFLERCRKLCNEK